MSAVNGFHDSLGAPAFHRAHSGAQGVGDGGRLCNETTLCYPGAMLLRVLFQVLQDPEHSLDALATLPDIAALSIVALLFGLTFHEASHGWVAWRLGDSTAKDAGRVSLNPLRHLHPVGTLLLLFIGIGFGRPVPIDPFRLRFGPTRGSALVGLAGPITNLVLAGLLALPVRLGMLKWHSPLVYGAPFAIADPAYVAADVLGYFVAFNILLAAFNLIPVAPLDGSRLLGFFLPPRAFPWLVRYELLGPTLFLPLVLVLLIMDLTSGGARLFGFIQPLANFLTEIVVGRPLVVGN